MGEKQNKNTLQVQRNQCICRAHILSHKVIQVWRQMGLAGPAHWTHGIHRYAYAGETTICMENRTVERQVC